jgi:hypothetical protein
MIGHSADPERRDRGQLLAIMLRQADRQEREDRPQHHASGIPQEHGCAGAPVMAQIEDQKPDHTERDEQSQE